MARLPYADLSAPAARSVIERIIAERGSVLHLYQMLIHSVPLTEGWLVFLTAVRHKCGLAGAPVHIAVISQKQVRTTIDRLSLCASIEPQRLQANSFATQPAV